MSLGSRWEDMLQEVVISLESSTTKGCRRSVIECIQSWCCIMCVNYDKEWECGQLAGMWGIGLALILLNGVNSWGQMAYSFCSCVFIFHALVSFFNIFYPHPISFALFSFHSWRFFICNPLFLLCPYLPAVRKISHRFQYSLKSKIHSRLQ